MSETGAAELPVETGVAKGGKYLTFALADEEYGVEILKVREIVGFIPVTAVPRMPPHVKGVVNLRGQVIPVIDLRGMLRMGQGERTEQTCIVVVDTQEEGGAHVNTGIIVDRVSEVLDIPGQSIEPPLRFGCEDHSLIMGLGKMGESIKLILDIDRAIAAAW